jgi:glycosyltransferase involved in cell wall biosynthesis
MCRLLEERGGSFLFIQTQEMEEERLKMGWKKEDTLSFVRCFYKDEEQCRRLIMDSDVVLFGGCDDESYIQDRLKSGRIVIRISERLYKTGQWKAVSPRGLIKKYHDHTGYRNAQVYLLCAGGYVASDFHIVRAYPGKMYKWGYFPRTVQYDVDKLMSEKGWNDNGDTVVYILWAGRFIDWKHPELALETAEFLKKKNIRFHMDIIGGGDMEKQMKLMLAEKNLGDVVTMTGFKSPEEVRRSMEKADIFLFTSDRQEGWGAVANEAMNSGCAVIADHMIGAVPYLIRNEQNGCIYKDGDRASLFEKAEYLTGNPELVKELGRNAYETIVSVWNAENAAAQLLKLTDCLMGQGGGECMEEGNYPCAPEKPIPERKMYKNITEPVNNNKV